MAATTNRTTAPRHRVTDTTAAEHAATPPDSPREVHMIAELYFRMLCLFDHHTRGPSDEMWHDGLRFRSVCRGCGRPLARTKVRWRRQDQL